MPNHVQSPRALPYLRAELETFKKAVEEWTGKTITDEDLDRGIEVMNRHRQLMRDAYDTRKAADPPMSGLEAMYMAVSSQMIDKTEHSNVVEESMKELQTRKLETPTGQRLMIIGSEDDDSTFIDMVENCGSTIVVDDHCTGSRYFWKGLGGEVEDPAHHEPGKGLGRKRSHTAPAEVLRPARAGYTCN
jgi:benzoyl-CoA reductase subunit C